MPGAPLTPIPGWRPVISRKSPRPTLSVARPGLEAGWRLERPLHLAQSQAVVGAEIR